MNARVTWAALCLLAACGRDPAAVPAVGTLERDRIELVAEANEPILSLDAKEGDTVAAGDVVLALDTSRLAAQVTRERATRDQLKARLAELERGPRAERIRGARARLVETESQVQDTSRDYERARQLTKSEVMPQSQSDTLRARREQALARRDEARATLQALETGTTAEELAQARSALAASEAAVADIEVRLERLTVRAPRAGRVDSLPFERGERPPAGAVVAVLLSSDPPYARVYVPEAVRARISTGTQARVQIAGREGELQGHVRELSHEAAFTPYFALTQYDRGRLSYLAEVELTGQAAEELPTGVPVEVRFDLDPARAASAK